MSVFDKKNSFSGNLSVNSEFVKSNANDDRIIEKRGRPKKRENSKRTKSFTIYFTQSEYNELEKIAESKHSSISEYIRTRIF